MRIAVPMLFVEGANDPFCRLDLLEEVLARVAALTETHLIEGGNHDLRVPKRQGREPEKVWQEAVQVICRWRADQSGGGTWCQPTTKILRTL